MDLELFFFVQKMGEGGGDEKRTGERQRGLKGKGQDPRVLAEASSQ